MGSPISTSVFTAHMGIPSSPPLEVDAMNEQILFTMLETHRCSVSQNSNFLSEYNEKFKFIENNAVDLKSGIKMLTDGEVDLLALPGDLIVGEIENIISKDCEILGAKFPRRPNSVLVSYNKLYFQPKSAIIITDSELIRRQLIRVRPDISVKSPSEISNYYDIKTPNNPSEIPIWLEDLCEEGKIDGFVIPRTTYDILNLKLRRHALLSQPQEMGDPYFLPSPFSDLLVFIARSRFPPSISKQICELEGNTNLWVQSRVLNALGSEMMKYLGIEVRHRQVPSLLKQSEDERDPLIAEACISADGEIQEDEVHIEIRMEVISFDGKRTLSIQRITPYSGYEFKLTSTIIDWKKMIDTSTGKIQKDHPKDIDSSAFLVIEE